MLLVTPSRDEGMWGVYDTHRPTLRVHANLMNRGIDSHQAAGQFPPHVPLSPAVLRLQKSMLGTFANLAKTHPYRTGFISNNMARVFQSAETRTMSARRPVNYLRTYRLRWGLSKKELAYLLGWDRPDAISRIEKKQRAPTLNFVIACFILFGTQPGEVFPDISADVEALVMARICLLCIRRVCSYSKTRRGTAPAVWPAFKALIVRRRSLQTGAAYQSAPIRVHRASNASRSSEL